MANTDNPRGLWPIRHLTGGNAFAINEYTVDSSNATAIFPGDAMILEADGNVAPYTSGGGNLIGVCAYVGGGFDNLSQRYLAASTAGTVGIYDDPDIVFGIQSDGTTDLVDVGNNCDVTATAGSTTSSMSRHEASATTTNTTAQLRLIRPIPAENNDVTAANSDWEVVINEHYFKSTAGI